MRRHSCLKVCIRSFNPFFLLCTCIYIYIRKSIHSGKVYTGEKYTQGKSIHRGKVYTGEKYTQRKSKHRGKVYTAEKYTQRNLMAAIIFKSGGQR